MPYDEALAERIRSTFDDLPGTDPADLGEMRMFGGVAFLINGNMAVAASSKGGLMVRVDPADMDRLVDSSTAEPMIMRGRPMKGWLTVSPEGVATKRQLDRWVRVGLTYARTLPAKRKR